MIGMNQIKMRLFRGIAIGLVVGIVGMVVMYILMNNVVKSYEEGTNTNFLRDYTSNVVTLTQDVIQGTKITNSMLKTTTVHKNIVPKDAITDANQIIGKIAKYNMAENTTVVSDMFTDEIIADDVRIQEISSILLPIDLVEGDFVDVRIMFPSGVEYVVLAQKKVNKIYGSVVWMDLTEEELLLLNSATIDTYLTSGSKLYAVRYTDPTSQIKLGNETDLNEAAGKARALIQSEIEAEINKLGTPNAKQLTELLYKYALEYRYYIGSYMRVEVNYQPNEEIIKFVNSSNSETLKAAQKRLSLTARTAIETSIELFENKSGEEAYEQVVNGITTSTETLNELRSGLLQ